MSCFLVVFFRGIEAISYGIHSRSIFWDEQIFRPFLEFFQVPWSEFTQSASFSLAIDQFEKCFGFTLIFLAIGLIYSQKKQFLCIVSFLLLAVIYFIKWKEKFFYFPMLLETLGQLFVPLIYLFGKKGGSTNRLAFFTKLAIGLTFLGHGVFALGIYPTPGHFIDYVIVLLGISEKWAQSFLVFVGIIDVLIFPLLFVKNLKIQKWALQYMVFWGAVTALARPLFYYSSVFFLDGLKIGMIEFFVRAPHYLIPFFLLIVLKDRREINNV